MHCTYLKAIKHFELIPNKKKTAKGTGYLTAIVRYQEGIKKELENELV